MSEEPTFTTYSFTPDSNFIHGEKGISYQTSEAMKYANLDKSNRKQEKSRIKRSARRRVEKVRNFHSSDMESDTGSDGLAVNSEGSGRSGDWGPPQLRRKPKAHRKRTEARISYTDSGISLSKTDLESLSGLSLNTHCTQDYRHLNKYGLTTQVACAQLNVPRETKTSPLDLSLELDVTSKGLPYSPAVSSSPCKLNDQQGEHVQPLDNALDIEEKENIILEQCIRNEKLGNLENASKNVIDCNDASRESRFPLPDHLNYPICRYRTKSESENRLHPLKKLKDGWRRLRSRKLFPDKQQYTSADTDCYPEFYPPYVSVADNDEDDSEVILSRLSRNPNGRKNIAKRLFGRFGSKSYSISNAPGLDENGRGKPRLSRSGSTLSVPGALQDMWNKVHCQDLPSAQPARKPLHKVNSMPSIHSNNIQREDSITQNGFIQPVTNTEKHRSNSEKVINNNGTELIDSLSSLHITQDRSIAEKKVSFNNNTTHYYDDFKCSPSEKVPEADINTNTNSLVRSSSCHELYNRSNRNQKANYVVPQKMYYSPAAPCACCIPGQQVQFVPFYPYPNYVIPVPSYGGYPPSMDFVPNYYPPVNAVPSFYPLNGDHRFHMMNGLPIPVDNVVAPLDVTVETDKKAEKRKISEIVFDTFV